jgi:hypothetical protein
MSRIEKLVERFRRQPTDFTWSELQSLLGAFGFNELRNHGSRRKFYQAERQCMIILHEPHPHKVLKAYAMKEVSQKLHEAGFL